MASNNSSNKKLSPHGGTPGFRSNSNEYISSEDTKKIYKHAHDSEVPMLEYHTTYHYYPPRPVYYERHPIYDEEGGWNNGYAALTYPAARHYPYHAYGEPVAAYAHENREGTKNAYEIDTEHKHTLKLSKGKERGPLKTLTAKENNKSFSPRLKNEEKVRVPKTSVLHDQGNEWKKEETRVVDNLPVAPIYRSQPGPRAYVGRRKNSAPAKPSDRKRKKMYSDYVGVTFNKTHNKFQACITHYRKQHYLGRYKLSCDAAKAYDESARRLKGQGWKVNFQTEEDYQLAREKEQRQLGIIDISLCKKGNPNNLESFVKMVEGGTNREAPRKRRQVSLAEVTLVEDAPTDSEINNTSVPDSSKVDGNDGTPKIMEAAHALLSLIGATTSI